MKSIPSGLEEINKLLDKEEKISIETLEELSNNRGDDEDE